MVETRPPTPADINALAANLRQQDRDELDAAGYTDHHAVIAHSVARSDWALTALPETLKMENIDMAMLALKGAYWPWMALKIVLDWPLMKRRVDS